MVAYEIYEHDLVKGYKPLGVLPERRKNLARITKRSIINWGRKFFEKNININGIFLFQLEIDINTGNTYRRAPSFITQSRNLRANSP
jgi:hypothetical protein